MFETIVQHFSFNNSTINLVIPNTNSIQQWFSSQQKNNKDFPFPYWAKVWPSAIALANFIETQSHLVANKNVLELAAGLGLPSLVAARFADKVICSDYVQEPLSLVKQSIIKNHFVNVECCILNWNNLPEDLSTEVLLLSDINYNPSAFNKLFKMIQFFLQKNSTIILATPQRIMAKPFIETVLPFCIEQTEMVIEETIVSILVLRENN